MLKILNERRCILQIVVVVLSVVLSRQYLQGRSELTTRSGQLRTRIRLSSLSCWSCGRISNASVNVLAQVATSAGSKAFDWLAEEGEAAAQSQQQLLAAGLILRDGRRNAHRLTRFSMKTTARTLRPAPAAGSGPAKRKPTRRVVAGTHLSMACCC